MRSMVTLVDAVESVKVKSRLDKRTLAALHLEPTDTVEVQTGSKNKTVATYEAGKTYGNLNGIAAAYDAAMKSPGKARVYCRKIDRVIVRKAA